MLTWKGQRMLVSTWKRWTQWEFWPMGLVYPPVLIYILYLGIKHRGLTLFTAVNPGIPASGFIEESKSAILRGLGDNGGAIARWDVVPAHIALDAKIQQLEHFMQVHQLSYPIVLKPDVGQRGEGVAIVQQREAAVEYLTRCPEDVIVQQYVDGAEYGVFYYRYPGNARGAILGITTKELIHVIGNGKLTLEQLILKDERAVCMAPFFFKKHKKNLNVVINNGERYALVELGTHCRGSTFRDGSALLTDELMEAIDVISQNYAGFYFGRYDIKVPSAEHLQQGRGIQVIELNGVTSEATYMYDPKHSVWFAWKTLFGQWRIAFEIAAANRKQGASSTSVGRLVDLLWRRRTKQVFEAV